MNLLHVLPIAFGALLRNKTRSFLTALGVIIGVASVISMVAVGEGAKARVAAVFSGSAPRTARISSASGSAAP
jgi:putative ABC transport system permease protein